MCGTPHHYRTNSSTEETRFRERHLQAPVSPWLLPPLPDINIYKVWHNQNLELISRPRGSLSSPNLLWVSEDSRSVSYQQRPRAAAANSSVGQPGKHCDLMLEVSLPGQLVGLFFLSLNNELGIAFFCSGHFYIFSKDRYVLIKIAFWKYLSSSAQRKYCVFEKVTFSIICWLNHICADIFPGVWQKETSEANWECL